MVIKIRSVCHVSVALVLAVSTIGLGACSKGAGGTPEEAESAPLLLSPEDLVTVSESSLASGPLITGSVEAERRADLRAEVPAIVLAVLKENGDPVRRGDLLVRLDPTAIRDALTSAEASARAADLAYQQAERQYQRLLKLRQENMVSAQQLEDAEIQRNSAQSEAEAARTRVVAARQQLERTEVRAPFDGLVSNRKVSAGDTASVGKELMQVMDPASMRFEGRVSADSIGEVAAGQIVHFRVQGFQEADFAGTVVRVNPAANETTRQVEVLVSFDNPVQIPGVAGLYAEGRIESQSAARLTVAAPSIQRDGDNAFAWRFRDGVLAQVSLDLGAYDARTGRYVVDGGLAEGDAVLRYPGSTLKDGQAAQLAGSSESVTMTAEQ
ncbi:MAG TPA: efflux RND transporter periplasmic adaptor subunit [Woeseiaceae bacterium]|nr:efflux RND transporter periplasmic adaptor subunit [Woeseiaceae bacterium]